jgi:hypothetical protein
MRRWLLATAVGAVACGGAAPTAPYTSPPGPLSGPLSLSGRIVRAVDAAPVAGAVLEVSQGTAKVATTDAEGRFALDGLPATLLSLTFTAPGYLTHRSKLMLADSRQDLTFDLIPDAAPFDLAFYRELARGGYDGPLDVTRRWTMDPSFYLQTRTFDTGDPVPAEILDDLERVFVNAVPELTGGRFRVKTVARGPDLTAPENGWVRVWLFRNPIDGRPLGGDATLGGNQGRIRIRYDPALDELGRGVLGCRSSAIHIADHEIVHIMGLRHTSTTFADFQSGTGCPGAGRPARVAYHASVMYSRPPGNQDVDNDAPGFMHVLAGAADPPAVSCGLDHFVR